MEAAGGIINDGLALWHVKHDDGDLEDLEEDEYKSFIESQPEKFKGNFNQDALAAFYDTMPGARG